ncbi:MAG TPA: pitrilysin family protein [Thermoanaerobaculia bacterium]|jgi:zinc protease
MRPFPLPPFVEERLPSGLTLRAARWGKRPSVAAALLFPGAGSVSDSEGLEGLAEVASDTFLDGTRSRSGRELAEAIDDLALSLDVSAGYDSAVAHMAVLERDLDAGLTLFAEVLSEPAFLEVEVDRNRRRHVDSLREQRSEPDFLGRERLLAELYPGHPYGRLAATEKGLLSLTAADVQRFFSSRFTFTNATLVLVGPGDEGTLLSAAARAFRTAAPGATPAWAPPSPPAPRSGLSFHLIDRKESVQTNLLFARPALRRADPLFVAAVVANQSLGGGASSRLFRVLREERGLTYGTYSSVAPRLTAGHFGASIDCRTDATREALAGLLDLIRAFAAEGPTEEEHARSRRYLTGSFAISHETPGALVQDELTRILHGLPEDAWQTWRERVDRVTREEARDVAARFFSPEVGVVTAVGQAAVIRPVLESFGETTVWDADGPRV